MSESAPSEDVEDSRRSAPVAEPVAVAPTTNSFFEPPYTHTRASGFWAAVVGGLLMLVLLIIFILENGQDASVSFLGTHSHLPEGVALLLAAVIGGLLVVAAAVARIVELRRRTGRRRSGPRQARARRIRTKG